MPAPIMSVPGGSGMQTQQVIQQLMEIERRPLRRLEEDNKRNQVRIQAWEELRNKSRTLVNLSRDLYSFSGPFTVRTIVSSDPGAITGSTSPNVEEVSQSIRVLELASYHQIHSRPIADSEQLPPAKFTINTGGKDIPVRFAGGDIFALERTLRQQGGKDFEASTVRISSETALLTLRSGTIGAAGALRLSDPDGLLGRIELVGSKKEEKSFDEALSIRGHSDPIEVPVGVVLQPELSSSTNLRRFEFSSALKENPDTKAAPSGEKKQDDEDSVRTGPDLREDIAGVEVTAPDIERRRPTGKKAESADLLQGTVTLVCDIAGTRREFRVELRKSGRENVNLAALAGGPVKLVEIRVQMEPGRAGEFRGFRIEGSREEEGLFGPRHETTPAKDARLLVNGVEVTRPKNDGITDLIQGASLSLHRPTESPVFLKVQHQSDEIKKKIKAWVDAYNAVVTFVRDNSQYGSRDDFQINRPSDPSAGIDEGMRKLEDANGIFAGDAVTRRLVIQMQTAVSQTYPARQAPAYRVLSEVGISTGSVGSDWKDIKKGLLVIDDAKLDEALGMHPESVREIFAADSNEDGVTDNGVAFVLYRDLNPYVSASGGIIGGRIDLLQDRIKGNKKRAYEKELSMKKKEEILRAKFGRMDSQIRESRATSEYLKSRLGTGAGGE